jgi:TolB-like protein/AraC-like DNA-binding protein
MPEKHSMDEAFIQKLNDILDINLPNENFGVSELAIEVGYSRSQLHRKLNEIADKSSSQFIREYRLQKAMEMLKLDSGTASEISYQVGFSSPSYFSTCFNNFYGYPPGEVKYQRAIVSPKKTFSKKLAAIIPIILFIGLLVFNEAFNKDTFDSVEIEKTIAVMPFINNSSNEENMYFCNGIMAGIHDHLAKIPEFFVVSRLSVEPYRHTSSPLKVIGKELDVNYVVEGHVQRIGNRAIISAELIQVNSNKVLWSGRYDKDVSEVFVVQANVIQSITNNLEIIISSNLKDQLNTKPTQDTLAYDHFLKGEEYRFKANRLLQKTEIWINLLDKAKLSYEMAIERDSMFAQAYLGLAFGVLERNGPYLGENDLDEMIPLTNKAIKINPNLSDSYALKGVYFHNVYKMDLAKKNIEKSLELNPNNRMALMNTVQLYLYDKNYKDAIIALNKMERLAESKSQMIMVYRKYGFFNGLMERYDAEDYFLDKSTENDTKFNISRAWFYIKSKRFEEAISYVEKRCIEDNQNRNSFLGWAHVEMKNYTKALEYYKKWYELVSEEGINCVTCTYAYQYYGMALLASGQREKGIEILEQQLDVFDNILSSKRAGNYTKAAIYYHSIGLYATLGQMDKAYESMLKFEEFDGWVLSGGMYVYAKFDIQLDILRNDPEFIKFMKRGETHLDGIQNQIRPYLPKIPAIKTE